MKNKRSIFLLCFSMLIFTKLNLIFASQLIFPEVNPKINSLISDININNTTLSDLNNTLKKNKIEFIPINKKLKYISNITTIRTNSQKIDFVFNKYSVLKAITFYLPKSYNVNNFILNLKKYYKLIKVTNNIKDINVKKTFVFISGNILIICEIHNDYSAIKYIDKDFFMNLIKQLQNILNKILFFKNNQ